ncbi:hypothetical protein M0Q97_13520 [Candidatus Dojkabacteria bacterium]|jgi:hypothetical protein|nr:hypothetical protein [Candidatus Dojkabacteria bacterium]
MFNSNVTYTYNYWNVDLKYMAQHGHNDLGIGDGLYRTSLAYIAYGDSKLMEGIFSSFREFGMINKKAMYVQGARAPFRYREDDFSRDQFILAVSALYIKGNTDKLNYIIDRIPYRLSRRFRMTPTLWFWSKGISGKNKRVNLFIYNLLETITQLPIIAISKLASRLIGLNVSYSIEELLSIDPSIPYWHFDTINKQWIWKTEPSSIMTLSHKFYNEHLMKLNTRWWYKLVNAFITPSYSIFLSSIMAYCGGSKLTRNLLLRNVSEYNTLIRLLLKDRNFDVNKSLSMYTPCTGMIWADEFNGTSMKYRLTEKESEYNDISYDIVKQLANDKL